jgi:hypothetical protein
MREQLKARRPEPAIRGFLQVALRRYLSVAPTAKRREILQRLLSIESSYDARRFIEEAKEAVRAHKLLHPRRKPWKIRAAAHRRKA